MQSTPLNGPTSIYLKHVGSGSNGCLWFKEKYWASFFDKKKEQLFEKYCIKEPGWLDECTPAHRYLYYITTTDTTDTSNGSPGYTH